MTGPLTPATAYVDKLVDVVERSLAGLPPKEFEIAIEALGRPADYNPAVDATVRVEAGRLRNRLREYYTGEGAADPVLIEIPKGAYSAVFSVREGFEEAADPIPKDTSPLPSAVSFSARARCSSCTTGSRRSTGSPRPFKPGQRRLTRIFRIGSRHQCWPCEQHG